MSKLRAVKTKEEATPFLTETVLHYELRTGIDRETGKELSPHEKMRRAHCLLDPSCGGIRDVVDFAYGLALIFNCIDERGEEWAGLAAMVAAPLRTVVEKAKNEFNEMEKAHSVLGDVLKSLSE